MEIQNLGTSDIFRDITGMCAPSNAAKGRHAVGNGTFLEHVSDAERRLARSAHARARLTTARTG